jgi:hypothetical protein
MSASKCETKCIKWASPDDKLPACDCEDGTGCAAERYVFTLGREGGSAIRQANAQCSYCGRYSDDPNTLGDRYQPLCDCGKRNGWTGSFVPPTTASKWSSSSGAYEHENLEPAQPQNLTLVEWLQERRDNALLLAKEKLYDPGWLEDASYFQRALDAIQSPACESLVSFDDAVAQWESREDWQFADAAAMRSYFYGAGRAVATAAHSRGAAFLQTLKEAAVAMAQHMPDKRETHDLFAALSDHSETEEHLSRAENDRLTAIESALQFADYLATASTALLSATAHVNTVLNIRMSPALSDAVDDQADCCTKLEREVYEYRKRRRATKSH